MRVTQVEQFADRLTNTLSGGECARVWLAMCLAQDTDYLLLDEPLAALDMRHHYKLSVLFCQLYQSSLLTLSHAQRQ